MFPKILPRFNARHDGHTERLPVAALKDLLDRCDVLVAVFAREVGWDVSVVVDAHHPLGVFIYPQPRLLHEFQIA